MTPQPSAARRLARKVLPAPVRTVSVKVLPVLGSHTGAHVASDDEPATPAPQPARSAPRHAKPAPAPMPMPRPVSHDQF